MKEEDAWNELIHLYNKNIIPNSNISQNEWELLFSKILNYSKLDINSKELHKYDIYKKHPDIIISNEKCDLFLIEYRHNSVKEGEKQVIGFLNEYHINIGILICENLYIYYSDFSEKDSKLILKIPLEKNNKMGNEFIRLFSKETFNTDIIKSVIYTYDNPIRNHKQQKEYKPPVSYAFIAKSDSDIEKMTENDFEKYLKSIPEHKMIKLSTVIQRHISIFKSTHDNISQSLLDLFEKTIKDLNYKKYRKFGEDNGPYYKPEEYHPRQPYHYNGLTQ